MKPISFQGYLPPPRYDGNPFTVARIEESATETGPWTAIETIVLDPVDPNPAEPMPRNFTTENATIEGGGWYRIIFVDADADLVPTTPVHDIPPDDLDFWPSVIEVAAYLRARTRTSSTQELGTFTEATRPTASEVANIIGQAVGDITLRIGHPIPESLVDDARRLTALRAAMLVELNYFPEAVTTGRSPYAQYKELYDEMILVLADRVASLEPVDTALVGGMAQFGFPTEDGLVGWESEW